METDVPLASPDFRPQDVEPAFMCSKDSLRPSQVDILMDSGAAVSLTPDKRQFNGTLKSTKVRGVVADGSKFRFGGVGSAFGLDRVFYMPEAKATLISMGDLRKTYELLVTDEGKTFLFLNRTDGTEAWRFILHNNLYKLAPQDLSVYSVFTPLPQPGAKASVLHRRMAHASWRQLRALVKNKCINDLGSLTTKDFPTQTPHCDGCALGKIRRSPFAKVS